MQTDGQSIGKPIDMHVHIVGTGSGGTGCWLRLRGWKRAMAAFMLWHIGMPLGALGRNFDELYVEMLLRVTRSSSLGKVVILAMDEAYDESGKIIDKAGTFYVPNDYVLNLARRNPEFLPCVSIHPARVDALEELERCLAAGAVMMKCLPNCQNIDCSNRRFTRFWERMAEAKLPLLAHTGGEHTVKVLRPELSNPCVLQHPLECGVNVIAGHCGTKSGLFDRDYFPVFLEMTRKYSNLYGDTSAFNVPIRGNRIRETTEEPLMSRMVHGSDFPVPVMGHWAWLRGYISREDLRKATRVNNLLERDYQLKKSMGYSPEVFTRIRGLLRASNCVLEKRH